MPDRFSPMLDGVHNLAPFSQFNNLNFDPPYVMFSANNTHKGTPKDSATNAQESGFFVWNLATWDLRDAVNKSAMYLAPSVDEFDIAGVTKEYSTVFPTCPRVKESPVHFDCKYYTTIKLPGRPPLGNTNVVIAEVVGIHIKDEVLTDGILDVRKTQPIARCGYSQYARITETFDMVIPSSGDADGDMAMNSGLEGSVKDMIELAGRIGSGREPDDGKQNEITVDTNGEAGKTKSWNT
jgi:flavin reductase (DIM6/NTAB) family NADH-FMN oxidoreductase RutF